jgi:hypothetical protein
VGKQPIRCAVFASSVQVIPRGFTEYRAFVVALGLFQRGLKSRRSRQLEAARPVGLGSSLVTLKWEADDVGALSNKFVVEQMS